MAKEQVIRQSLKDQIKTILIDRMIHGELVPGDRIKELKVAAEFGTSQSPVREAIRCLETLGYVEHIPHVGARVKRFDRQEIEEAYQVREALEVHSVSLIKQGLDDLADELDQHLEKMRQAMASNNIRQFIEADNSFHRAIVACCGNETMLTMWESLKMQLQVIATLMEAAMSLDEIYALHPPVVAAFKDRNQDASVLLRGHYESLGDYWEGLNCAED
jgi:DNA-binding GntR family transcriptional regulator